MSEKTSLIPFIHVLRGLAPLVVVWSHLAGWWFLANGVVFDPWVWYVQMVVGPLRLSQGGGHFGVVLFFAISGYIISSVATRESRLEFVIKRVFRLMPALFAAVAIMWVLTDLGPKLGLAKMIGNEAVTARDYFASALLLNYPIDHRPLALGPTWSLYAEGFFYFLVVLILPLMAKRPVPATWLLTAISFAVVVPWQNSTDLAYLCYFSIYTPLFIIGRIFYLDHTKQISARSTLIMVIANSLLFALLYEFRWPGQMLSGPQEPIWTYLGAIVVFYGTMQWRVLRVPTSIAFLAKISYSLYLVHLPVGAFAMSVALSAGLPPLAILAVGVASSILVATGLYHAVEKPSQRLARTILAGLDRRTGPLPVAG